MVLFAMPLIRLKLAIIRSSARVPCQTPFLTKIWVDAGFKVKLVEHGAALGVDVEIVTKDPQVKGFSAVKSKWIVERAIGWLMQHRWLVRDYELPRYRGNSYYPEALVIPS